MNDLPPKILKIRANICNIKGLGHEMDFKNLDKKGQIYPKEGTRKVFKFFRGSSNFISKIEIPCC
jgi:hypothetical protein